MSAPGRDSPTEPAAPKVPLWRDSMVWVVGGIITLVVLVNMVMIWIAVAERPNLVRTDYYQASKRVDSESAALHASAAAGWQVTVEPSSAPAGQLALRVTARSGGSTARTEATHLAASQLAGTVRAYRPNDARLDQTLVLSPDPADAGLYRAEFKRPAPGRWWLSLDLRPREGSASADTGRLYLTVEYVSP